MSKKPTVVIIDKNSISINALHLSIDHQLENEINLIAFCEVDETINFIKKESNIILVITEIVFYWYSNNKNTKFDEGIRILQAISQQIPVIIYTYTNRITKRDIDKLLEKGFYLFNILNKSNPSSIEIIKEEIKESLTLWNKGKMTIFISYSHKDKLFVDHLEDFLKDSGFRLWRDIHDATSGRLEKQIEQAIQDNRVVIIILSKNSIKSDWVQHEARLARNKEQEIGKDILCPIALDDSWKTCDWPVRLKEQILEYNILDFTNWKNRTSFEEISNKLIKGLNNHYF